jgi:hypothetical protein
LNTYGYVGGNPLSYADPYGLFCISKDAKNGLSGFAGGTASALISVRDPKLALALGAINGVVGYVWGPSAGGAVTGAISGGLSGSTASFWGATVGGATGGLSGWEGTGLGGLSGGLLSGILHPDYGKYGGNNWTRSGGASMVKGGLSGIVGGLAGQGTEWTVDQLNNEYGDCSCAK